MAKKPGKRPGKSWPWWLVSVIGAIATMVVTAAVLYMPSGRGTIILLVGAAVFLVILLRDPRYWLRRTIGAMVGLLASSVLLPGLKAFVQFAPGTLGYLVMENAPWQVPVAIAAAIVSLVLVETRAGKPARVPPHCGPPSVDATGPGAVAVGTAIKSPITPIHFGDQVGRDVYHIGNATFAQPPSQIPVVATAPAPLHQLPSPPADFVGREDEIAGLMAAAGKDGANISGVRGMGGIGKTALALVVAHRLAECFKDAQFYLDLRGTSDKPLSADDAMRHVLQSLNPTAKLPDGSAQLAASYRDALHGKRTILLMDNARDATQITPLLPPQGNMLLVTSRWHFAVPGIQAIDLGLLPPEEAVKLLLSIAPRIGEHAAALAELCGRLPLALRAAASLLAVQMNLSPNEYVERLRTERNRLKALGKEGVEIDVEACLDQSYRLLPAPTAAVFRNLAVFPGSFDAAAEEGVCEDPGHAGLDELLRYSLAEYDEPTSRYRLHDLVRVFAGSRTGEDERFAGEKRHAKHYLGVLRKAGDLYLKGGDSIMSGLSLFDRERANIQAGQAWSAANAQADDDACRLCSEYPDAGAYCLDLRQHPRRERVPWLEEALSAARRLKDRAAESRHLGNLGLAWADLGEPRKAIEFYEQHLAIAREIGDRRGEGQDLGNLGNAWADLGEPRKAIEFYEKYLAIAREIGDRRGEGNALGNLGIAWSDLGEQRKAIEFYEQHLAIAREIGDRRGEGNALGNLGVAWKNLGEPRKAIEFYEKQLAITREIGDRRGEGNAQWNMALAYREVGEKATAIPLAEAALGIFEQIEDPNAEMVRRYLAEWRKE